MDINEARAQLMEDPEFAREYTKFDFLNLSIEQKLKLFEWLNQYEADIRANEREKIDERLEALMKERERQAVEAFAEKIKNYQIKTNGFGNERLGRVRVMLQPEVQKGKYRDNVEGILDQILQEERKEGES